MECNHQNAAESFSSNICVFDVDDSLSVVRGVSDDWKCQIAIDDAKMKDIIDILNIYRE